MAYFDRVDVNRIAAELRVADRAAEEGRRQQKLAGTDGSVDDTQRIIMGAMTERWNLARTRAEEALKDIEVKLSGIDLGATLNVLNTLKADTEMEVERTKGRFRDRLFGLRRHEGEMRSDLDFFQLKNDLHREAEYPESEILHWAIVVALVVTESLANSYFFAKGSDLGLLGGALQALLISCVNIGAALMAGVYLMRNLHHVETWRLGLSAMGICGYLVFMVFLNLATAHYRALLGSDPLTALVTVFKSLVENPFAINDFDASILLFIGIILAIAALVKAYMADDRYPGYGKFDRRYREADEAYMDGKLELREAVNAVIDRAREVLHGYVSDARQASHEFFALLAEAENIGGEFSRHAGELKAAGHTLLTLYRTTFTKVRRSPPPDYAGEYGRFDFDDVLPKGDLPRQEGRRAGVSKDLEDIEENATKVMEDLKIVNEEALKAVESYFDEIADEADKLIAGGAREAMPGGSDGLQQPDDSPLVGSSNRGEEDEPLAEIEAELAPGAKNL